MTEYFSQRADYLTVTWGVIFFLGNAQYDFRNVSFNSKNVLSDRNGNGISIRSLAGQSRYSHFGLNLVWVLEVHAVSDVGRGWLQASGDSIGSIGIVSNPYELC